MRLMTLQEIKEGQVGDKHTITLHEAKQIFPYEYREYVLNHPKPIKMTITMARRIQKELRAEIYQYMDIPKSGLRDAFMAHVLNYVYIESQIEKRMAKIQELDRWIFLHSKRTKEVKGIDFERLKLVPIPNILEINRSGFASCQLHSDRTPSLRYYKDNNSWFCFSCNKGGDVIDLIQAIKGCTLKEAVQFLT